MSFRHKESTQLSGKREIANQHLDNWNLEFGNIGFFWRGESPAPGDKPSEKGEDQQQTKYRQHQARIEPRPHQWKGKGNPLTITPSMFP